MFLQLKENEFYYLTWSAGYAGKKVHVMQSWKRLEKIDWYPACGSGVNSAGQTCKAQSWHGVQTVEKIAAENICSKCVKKSNYVEEVK